jgi:chromosome segregation ATPase
MAKKGYMTQQLVGRMLFFCSLCAPCAAPAQATDDADVPIMNALLTEVRLLRQAIERQGTVAGRAQLLVGRLALQDERVARWHAEVQRLETEASSLALQRVATQAALGRVRNTLDQAKDVEQTTGMEHEVRMLEAQLKQQGANLVALETRRDETKQALEAGRAKYEELSDRFDQLERELDRSRR